MPDQPASMWTYWRDKKGFMPALEDYYPDLIKNDSMFSYLYMQIKVAQEQINLRMERKAQEGWNEE